MRAAEENYAATDNVAADLDRTDVAGRRNLPLQLPTAEGTSNPHRPNPAAVHHEAHARDVALHVNTAQVPVNGADAIGRDFRRSAEQAHRDDVQRRDRRAGAASRVDVNQV